MEYTLSFLSLPGYSTGLQEHRISAQQKALDVVCHYSPMPLFGNRDRFSISFLPNLERNSEKTKYAYCHLILGNKLIGDKNEICYLPTWVAALEQLKDKIKENRFNFRSFLFDNLDDNEIFELIYKSNQLEDEFDPKYLYLPSQPTNDHWYKHRIVLDETIDAFQIVAVEENEQLKFNLESLEGALSAS